MINKYYVLAVQLPKSGYIKSKKGDPYHKPKLYEYVPKETWYLQASGTPSRDLDRALRFETDKKAYAHKMRGGISLAGYKIKEITPDGKPSEANGEV